MEWLSTLLPYVSTFLGGSLLVFLTWAAGKSSGKAQAEKEQAQREVDAAIERKKVDEEVNKLNDSDLDDRLSKWVRK